MFLIFFIVSILLIIGFSVYAIFKIDNDIIKGIAALAIILCFGSSLICGIVASKAFENATISTIEITEVYKDEENSYCIRKSKDDEIIKITTQNIYKGDSNYLIRREYPNMSKMISFLCYSDKVEYDLVVTDLDIPELGPMD